MKIEKKKGLKGIKIHHNKKLLYVILLLLVLFIALIIVIYRMDVQEDKEVINGLAVCEVDNDCVKSSCCHPTSCVTKDQAPDCSDIFCSTVCEPDTLDCGQGKCSCVDNKCEAIMV